MKLKLYEIVNAAQVFDKLCETKSPSRVTHWIMKNIKIIRDDCLFFEKDRMRIINEYIQYDSSGSCSVKDNDGNELKDENGNPMLNYKDINKKSEYMNEIDKLNNLEIEISPYVLDYCKVADESPNYSIEPMYLVSLMDKFIKVD